MNKFLIPLILALIPQNAVSSINPEMNMPPDFNKNNYYNYYKELSTGGNGGGNCGYVFFENFYPSEYSAAKVKRPPFETWLCLFSVDVISNGYGPGQVLPEKVYLDKKTGLWKKKKYILSKEGIQRSRDVYGIKNLSELQPLDLYNIRSGNTKGYAVINPNVPLQKKQRGVKKILSFCLVQNQSYFSFCGSGSMVNLIDGKEVDFTPYMLKSLETVEIGLTEKPAK